MTAGRRGGRLAWRGVGFLALLLALVLFRGPLARSAPAPAASPAPRQSPAPAPSGSPALTPEQKTISELGLPPLVFPPGQPLTLDACIAITWRQHPVLASKQAIVLQQVALLGQVCALYCPQIGMQVQQIFQFNSLEALLPQQGQTILAFQQTLFDFGQRSDQLAAAQAAVNGARSDLQGAWVNQVAQVRQGYYQVLLASMLLAVAQEDLERNQKSLVMAQGFMKAGLKSMIDVTQAQYQVNQSQVTLAKAKNALLSAQVTLAQAAGLEASEVTSRPLEDILLHRPSLPTSEEAEAQMLKVNPALLSLDAQRASALATGRYQGKQWLPTAVGQATYGGFGNFPLPTPSALQVWSVSLTFTWPFYQPSLGPLVAQYRALALQLQKDRETRVLSLKQALQSAYADFEGAQQRVVAAVEENKTAYQNYYLARRRYESGIGSFIDVINARGFLLNARSDICNALHDRKLAEARISQAIGIAPLPRLKDGTPPKAPSLGPGPEPAGPTPAPFVPGPTPAPVPGARPPAPTPPAPPSSRPDPSPK